MNHGPDAYASQSWNDAPDGRRIMIDWMMAWRYARRLDPIPTRPWNGSMSLPRELMLRTTAQGVRLFQNPVAELAPLRERSCLHEGITVRADAPFGPDLAATCVEIETIANHGELVISSLVFPTPFGGDIRVFARGGAVALERLCVHQLGSVWNEA